MHALLDFIRYLSHLPHAGISMFPFFPGVIQNGQDANANDFLLTSTGAANSAQTVKLNSNGAIDASFFPTAFGNGADGNVTLDGTNTYAFLSKASSVYTMTRDTYFANLTINGSVTLVPNGFKIYASGVLSGSGIISANGNNGGNGAGASGGSGGAAVGSGPMKGAAGATASNILGTNGIAGQNGQLGSAGSGSGGGGASGNPGTSGASGGSITGNVLQIVERMQATMFGYINASGAFALFALCGAAAGGSGSQSGGVVPACTGGGGGSSGGIIWMAVYSYTGTLTLTATGGNGGTGFTSVSGGDTGGGGGGGGGNGGFILFLFRLNTGSFTTTLTGGTAGAAGSGVGGGTSGGGGTAGSAGVMLSIAVPTLL